MFLESFCRLLHGWVRSTFRCFICWRPRGGRKCDSIVALWRVINASRVARVARPSSYGRGRFEGLLFHFDDLRLPPRLARPASTGKHQQQDNLAVYIAFEWHHYCRPTVFGLLISLEVAERSAESPQDHVCMQQETRSNCKSQDQRDHRRDIKMMYDSFGRITALCIVCFDRSSATFLLAAEKRL